MSNRIYLNQIDRLIESSHVGNSALNNSSSGQYFSCQKPEPSVSFIQNHLTADLKVQQYHESSSPFKNKMYRPYDGPLHDQKQLIDQKNKSFNVLKINQYLSDIKQTFQRFQNQELSQLNLQKLNKLRRLLQIVHKFTVLEKMRNSPIFSQTSYPLPEINDLRQSHKLDKTQHQSLRNEKNKVNTQYALGENYNRKIFCNNINERKVLGQISKKITINNLMRDHSSSRYIDFGTQCDRQEKSKIQSTQNNEEMTSIISERADQYKQVYDKLIDLTVKSLNLSIHSLNLKSIELSAIIIAHSQCNNLLKSIHQTDDKNANWSMINFDQNNHCCKNHYSKQKSKISGVIDCLNSSNQDSFTKINPPLSAKQIGDNSSQQQRYSQLAKIKKQIKHLSVNQEDKQNINKFNGYRKGAQQQSIKKKLFASEELKYQENHHKLINKKLFKLESLYKQTKGIYREYEKWLACVTISAK